MGERSRRTGQTEPVSHRIMADARNRAIWELAAEVGMATPHRLLDLGCGTTVPLMELVAARPHLDRPIQVIGLDRTVAAAGDDRPPVLRADVTAIPLADASIDMACCFTLFSSIPGRSAQQQAAAEIMRVLAPGGVVAWYDLRVPSTNRRVVPLRRAVVRSLFPGFTGPWRAVSVFPPIARTVVPRQPSAYPALVALPFLRTHWAAALHAPT